MIKSRNLKLKQSIPADLPLISIDRDKIEQVLLNLIKNAIDFSSKGDTIDIAVQVDPSQRWVTIQVKDRGPGIPQELKPKIFDPFISSKKPCSGLGLAISKKIVLDHGGKIWFEERKGGGTIFIFTLPLGINQPGSP